MTSESTPRSRNWWFVQKVENLPDDWESQLVALAIPACYVVHDLDRKPLDDDAQTDVFVPVEPHVHCILSFSGQLRAGTVLDRLPESFGVKFVEPVGEKVGACTYLLHRNRTEREREYKAEYTVEDLHMVNGFKVNLSDVAGVGFANVYEMITTMRITSFADLMACIVEHYPSFLQYVSSHSTLVRNFIIDYARAIL